MSTRQYQEVTIEKTIKSLVQNKKVLLQSATGSGKTWMFAIIVRRFLTEYKQPVLIFVHRKKLMQQAAEAIEAISETKPCLITDKTKKYQRSRVYIAMIQSGINRLDLMDEPGLVICDECHDGSFKKVSMFFPNAFILGVSATPISSSKKDPIKNYYNDIVVGPQIKQLIAMGFLSQNITRSPKVRVDAAKLEVNKMTGDYNETQLSDAYREQKYVRNTLEVYYRFCNGKKTIIFNTSIAHNNDVNQLFILCGLPSRVLDSKMTEEQQEDVLEWFKITENAILQNVMITVAGFDEITVERIIQNFTTLSLTKLIQTGGRGGRIITKDIIAKRQHEYPYELKTKNSFEIIDMGAHCVDFGEWHDDRDWEHIFWHPDEPGEGVAPVKSCPACEGLVHASSTVCNLVNEDGEICGYVFDRKKLRDEAQLGEMLTITKGIDVAGLTKEYGHKYDYFVVDNMAEKIVAGLFEKHKNPSEYTLVKGFDMYMDLIDQWWYEKNKDAGIKIGDAKKSSFHIKKARYNYDTQVKKQKERYSSIENWNCHVCGAETDIVCDDCDYPVCEKHLDTHNIDKNQCKPCYENFIQQLTGKITNYSKKEIARTETEPVEENF